MVGLTLIMSELSTDLSRSRSLTNTHIHTLHYVPFTTYFKFRQYVTTYHDLYVDNNFTLQVTIVMHKFKKLMIHALKWNNLKVEVNSA